MYKFIYIVLFAAVIFGSCTTRLVTPLDIDDDWILSESENFNFYVKAGSLAEANLRTIIGRQQTGYRQLNEVLRMDYSGVINFYIHDVSPGSGIFPFMGRAEPDFETVFVSYLSEPIGKHEVVHIFAEQMIGRASIRMLNEGLAVALDTEISNNVPMYRGEEAVKWVRDIVNRSNGTITPIMELLREGDNMSTSFLYPQAGMFVHYLINEYGIDKFKQLYTVELDEFESKFFEVYEKDFDTVESEYKVILALAIR